MPSRNVIKVYIENGYYHIYNRGVEKRIIFKDTQDYKVFLTYLKEYLSPPPKPEDIKTIFILQGESFKGIKRQPKNYYKEIELISYCLMPNHFHLLIKQVSKYSIEKFIRSLATRYSVFFNKKYNRVGSLFQGPYKAVLISSENYLLHLSRYIHLNPSEYTDDLINSYSSYAVYLGLRRTNWVNSDIVLNYFNKPVVKDFIKVNTYKRFVEKYKKDSRKLLGKLTLEN